MMSVKKTANFPDEVVKILDSMIEEENKFSDVKVDFSNTVSNAITDLVRSGEIKKYMGSRRRQERDERGVFVKDTDNTYNESRNVVGNKHVKEEVKVGKYFSKGLFDSTAYKANVAFAQDINGDEKEMLREMIKYRLTFALVTKRKDKKNTLHYAQVREASVREGKTMLSVYVLDKDTMKFVALKVVTAITVLNNMLDVHERYVVRSRFNACAKYLVENREKISEGYDSRLYREFGYDAKECKFNLFYIEDADVAHQEFVAELKRQLGAREKNLVKKGNETEARQISEVVNKKKGIFGKAFSVFVD